MRYTLFLCLVCFLTFTQARVKDADGCPDTSGIVTACVFLPEINCLYNNQCQNGYKCCSYGCGKQCLAAASGPIHPGNCPPYLTGTGTTCYNDRPCKTNEKCCRRHCTKVRPFSVNVLYQNKN